MAIITGQRKNVKQRNPQISYEIIKQKEKPIKQTLISASESLWNTHKIKNNILGIYIQSAYFQICLCKTLIIYTQSKSLNNILSVYLLHEFFIHIIWKRSPWSISTITQ